MSTVEPQTGSKNLEPLEIVSLYPQSLGEMQFFKVDVYW